MISTTCTLQIFIDDAWREPGGRARLDRRHWERGGCFHFSDLFAEPCDRLLGQNRCCSVRLQADDGGWPNWASVVTQACDAAQVDHARVKAGVRMMAPPLGTLFADALALGVDEQFLTPLQKTMESVRKQLEKL